MLVQRFRIAVLLAACVVSLQARGEPFDFHQDDRIVFLGNTFAERMRSTGYFETAFLLRNPDSNLTFRNLGWSADEVTLRPRPLNFGDIHTHLANQRAYMIFVFYGSNESFQGKEGLSSFRDAFQQLIQSLSDHTYNGEAPPRLVVVSPIPQEQLPELPDPRARNRDIALYANAMRDLAKSHNIPYIDLFSAFDALYDEPDAPRLTINGIHVNAFGAWFAAHVMLDELGIVDKPDPIRIEAPANGEAVSIDSLTGGHYIPPPVPALPDALSDLAPTLRATNLPPGRYALQSNGKVLANADRAAWAVGVPLVQGLDPDYIEALRQHVVHKNRLFFDKWRAVNGFYIYGDRKEPFGVVNFPIEMKRFDEVIADEEALIKQKIMERPNVRLKWVRVD